MKAIPFPRLIAVGLVGMHVALLSYSICRTFPTRDEVAHVPAGLDCWQTGSFALYRVNPPLPRMLAVVPVWPAAPNTERIETLDAPGIRQEWGIAKAFANDNALEYVKLFRLARLAGLVWSVLGAWLIYRWAAELYGQSAGLLGLTLWCFGPNILAHAPLATPDLPATVCGLAASYVFWRYLRRGTWREASYAGLLLGVAQLTKFTLLVLYAVWPAIALLHVLTPVRGPFLATVLWARLAQGAWIGLLSLLVLNGGYLFDGTGQPLGEYTFVSRALIGEPTADGELRELSAVGNRFRGTWLAAIPVALPECYLTGLDLQRRDFEVRMPPSFLGGEWRDNGWWYYYLYALAIKAPLGAWLLVLWGLVLTALRHPASARLADELTLWLPALAVLTLVSSQTGFNHHMRYVLPMFPFVIVATGKLAYFLNWMRWKSGLAVLALVAWAAGSSLSVYPHSLSYFNELAGGPDNGYKHLLDSNIDWGQDLLFLKDWVDEHPDARPLAIAYQNFVDYRIVGMEYPEPPQDPPATPADSGANLDAVGPQVGYFAVDVTSLTSGPYKYFARFEPVAKAGYSIFIYHVTLEEANRIRRELGLPEIDGDKSR